MLINEEIRQIIKKPQIWLPLITNHFKLHVLKKKYLASVLLAVTYKCQCRCEHCFASDLRKENSRELGFSDYKNIIEDAIKLGTIHVHFTGGEPMLYKHIYKLISFASSNNRITSLATNGILLTPKNVQKLKKSGLDVILISLDSTSEKNHDLFRGVEGVYKHTIQGLKNAKDSGICTIINTTITHQNISNGEIFKLLDLSKELKVEVNLNYPFMAGKWQNQFKYILNAEDYHIIESAVKEHRIRLPALQGCAGRGCPAGSERICITCYGDVIPCEPIHISFGNILKEPLDIIMKRLWKISFFNRSNNTCVLTQDDFIQKLIKPLNKIDSLPVYYKDHPYFKLIKKD